MSFIRVVITCQPVYKTHFSAISIPDPRPSGTMPSEGTADDAKVCALQLCSAAVDIANFNDYRPSCASSVLRLRIGLVSIHWSDQRAMRNSGTLAAFGIGRFISAWLMRFVAPTKLLGSYAMVNVALVGFAILRPSWAGLWALFATSFFMSLMFPTIFALGLKGLGPNTKIRRIVDRDGHRRRGNSHSAHGTDRRGSSHHRSGLHCPACGICRHRRVRIPWGTGTRCGRHSRQ